MEKNLSGLLLQMYDFGIQAPNPDYVRASMFINGILPPHKPYLGQDEKLVTC